MDLLAACPALGLLCERDPVADSIVIIQACQDVAITDYKCMVLCLLVISEHLWQSHSEVILPLFIKARFRLVAFTVLCKRAYCAVQGKEADHVIFSCVRAHPPHSAATSVGFLADVRRMNVALTRARCAHDCSCCFHAHEAVKHALC